MRTDGSIFDIVFLCFALLLVVFGALQCFWPSKMRLIRNRIGPKYNKESPLGQLMDRAHAKEFEVLSRMGGFFLFLGGVLALLSFFGYRSVFR